MRLPKVHRIGGFTLIELMVTVAVVAILAAMAAPALRDMIDRYRLRQAEEDLVSMIANARAAAVKLDRDVNVSFGSNSKGWCLGANAAAAPTGGKPASNAQSCVCSDSAPACTVDGQAMLIEPGKHAGVSLAGTTTALVFDGSLGLLSGMGSQALTLTSPSQNHTLQVTVTPLGQATVCAKTAATPGFDSCQ